MLQDSETTIPCSNRGSESRQSKLWQSPGYDDVAVAVVLAVLNPVLVLPPLHTLVFGFYAGLKLSLLLLLSIASTSAFPSILYSQFADFPPRLFVPYLYRWTSLYI